MHRKGQHIILNSDQFNISHSGGIGLFAFSWKDFVGVDIEQLNPGIEFNKLADKFFTKREAAVINSFEQEQKIMAFFNCWTRKEAFIKAHGKGLSLPLDQFEVTILEEEEVKLNTISWSPESTKDWSMISFAPMPDYLGALAVKGLITQISFYQ